MARENIKEVEEAVERLEHSCQGDRIIKQRCDNMENLMDEAWKCTVKAINEEVSANTGHHIKKNGKGANISMGQDAEYRRTSLGEHLSRSAAQDAREHFLGVHLQKNGGSQGVVCQGGGGLD